MTGLPEKLLRTFHGNPVRFQTALWPGFRLYDRQREVTDSIRNNDQTFVVAAHEMGKDFVSGYIALSFFLYPQMYFPLSYVRQVQARATPENPYPHTVRVVTTSIKDDHLDVLWGEIGRWIDTCRVPLSERKGGPLVIKHREIRKLVGSGDDKREDKISYLVGMVSKLGEGLTGHHAAYTLLIGDEASGLVDMVHDRSETWAQKMLYIGNPYAANNFFKRGVKAGDLLAKE